MRSTVLALCAALLLAGCGGNDDAAPTASKPAPARATCRKVAAPAPKGEQHLSKPTSTLAAGKRYDVDLQTNCGTITIRLATGLGSPGFSVVETPPSDLAYTTGVVAMAKTEADPRGASGSQFFIVTGDDAKLPPDYALVGGVVRGMDVAQLIGRAAVDAEDRPSSPVVIEKATLRTE